MTSELTVIVKDSEKTLKTKHLVYEPYTVHSQDPLIEKYINETIKNFDGEPTDVQIKINMTV